MKIAIDIGTLNAEDSSRGLGVYTKNLFIGLEKLAKKENFEIQKVDASKAKNLVGFDLVHYPKFDLFYRSLPIRKVIPSVVTIHDTTPLLYPKAYPLGVRGKINFTYQVISLKNVKQVITDSETSKKDIVRNLGVNGERINTVYLGPSVNAMYYSKLKSKRIKSKYNLPSSYVVYVGDVNFNKNVQALCEACVVSETHLVIVGKKAVSTNFDAKHIENQPLVNLLNKYGNNKYIHRVGFVDDKDLPNVLKGSFCLCQPSLYEGFGLGVLDAMTLGVPTISSKTQALVELYEGATLFIDGNSTDDIAGKILNVKNSSKLRNELIIAGKKKSATFSWDKCARETLEVYLKALR